MSLWSYWKSLLNARNCRRSMLTHARRQHILQRHRRTFLESLESRQLMAGVPPEFLTSSNPAVTEHGPAVLLSPDMVMTDANNVSYPESAQLSLYVDYQRLGIGLRHTGTGPGEIGYQDDWVSYSGNNIGYVRATSNGNMTVYLQPGASVEAIQALLRNLTVRARGDEIADGTRYVSVYFNEDRSVMLASEAVSTRMSIPVHTTGSNDTPALTEVEGGGSYLAGAPAEPLLDHFDISDPDYYFGEYYNSTLTVAITGNGTAADRLSLLDGDVVRVVNSNLYWGDHQVGTISGGEQGQPLQIQFGETTWPAVNDVFKHLAFSTNRDADATLDRQIQITFSDGAGAQADPALVSIDVIAPTAPMLDTSLSPQLRPTNEDALTPASTQVASLLKDAVTDFDVDALRGIAVTYAAAAHGKWQYALQKGQWRELGNPTATAAVLLPGWARLRFLPDANFNGTVSLRYRAWDQTEGTPGGVIDTLQGTGGLTSLSAEVETATISVLPVNDAPVLDNTVSPTLTGTYQGMSRTHPTPVLSLVWNAATDVDENARQGIAVYGASEQHGVWQYELTRGVWQTIGAVSPEAALLLPASAHIRFVPHRDFQGTVRLYYRAWDQTEGAAGERISLLGKLAPFNAFSAATEYATLTVDPPPVS